MKANYTANHAALHCALLYFTYTLQMCDYKRGFTFIQLWQIGIYSNALFVRGGGGAKVYLVG